MPWQRKRNESFGSRFRFSPFTHKSDHLFYDITYKSRLEIARLGIIYLEHIRYCQRNVQ